MGLTLASLLTQTVTRRPDAPALRRGDDGAAVPLTYAGLDAAAATFAGALREGGVAPGDRVALMAPNVPGFVIAYWATLRLGAVVVPMNPLLKRREIAYHLRDSGAVAFVFFAGVADEARAGAEQADVSHLFAVGPGIDDVPAGPAVVEIAQRQADDAAVLLYTSGTTGRPKGATLTQSNMLWNAHLGAIDLLEGTSDDRVIATLPLFHSFGQTVAMNATLHCGGELVLVPRFDAELVLSLIERHRATVFLGVPTMYGALAKLVAAGGRDVGSLRRCLSGGAALPAELMRESRELLGCPLLEGYGLSETSPVASFNSPDAWRQGSIGRPIWGVEMRVVAADGSPVATDEVGEIQIRGHNVMAGYHGRPDATADAIDAKGWFATGDLGRVDPDGFFFIVDRSKDLIIRGGLNVYPREVEEVLYEHPDVTEAAVVGLPHAQLGEEVAAVVALRPEAAFDPDALGEWVKERIAAYKYPRVIARLEALPKGPTGKILKRELDVQALTVQPADV